MIINYDFIEEYKSNAYYMNHIISLLTFTISFPNLFLPYLSIPCFTLLQLTLCPLPLTSPYPTDFAYLHHYLYQLSYRIVTLAFEVRKLNMEYWQSSTKLNGVYMECNFYKSCTLLKLNSPPTKNNAESGLWLFLVQSLYV